MSRSEEIPKIEIKARVPNVYSLGSIVTAPRAATPLDLKTACDNLAISSVDGLAPDPALVLVSYLVKDFFKFSHRTGLYNRQTILWEALSRVTEAEVYRLQKGIFTKTPLPMIDIVLRDIARKPLILAHIVEPKDESTAADNKLDMATFRSFIQRARKVQSRENSLVGVFLCYPEPFPEAILASVREHTAGTDPVARYESIWPSLRVPMNLLEMNWGPTIQVGGYAPTRIRSGQAQKVQLIHPDLGNKAKLGD